MTAIIPIRPFIRILLLLFSLSTICHASLMRIESEEVDAENNITIEIVVVDSAGNPITGAPVEALSENDPFQVSGPDGSGKFTITGQIDNSRGTSQFIKENNGVFPIDVIFRSDPPIKCRFRITPNNGRSGGVTIVDQVDTSANRGSAPAPTKTDGTEDTAANAADPVSTATREFFFYKQLLDLHGPTLPLDFSIFHGSQLRDIAFFDHLPEDFAHNHHLSARVIDLDGFGTFFNLEFHIGLGRIITFERTPPDTEWTLVDGERWKFTAHETSTNLYLCDPEQQRLYTFEKFPSGSQVEPAFITRIEDRNGNRLVYTQPTDPNVTGPTSVTDELGRTLTFTYGQPDELTADFREYLTGVTDHNGRTVTFSYTEIDGAPRLTSISDANSGSYIFTYDASGFMTGKTMPAGNTSYTQTYETIPDALNEGVTGAVTSQTDALGNTFTFADGNSVPGLGEKQVIVTNPDGSQFKHFHSGANVMTALVDELGHKQLFTADDARDRITAAVDRDGGNVAYTYRDSGHVTSTTNQIGDTTSYTFVDTPQTFTNPDNGDVIDCTFADLQRIDYADGTSTQFVRDLAGNTTTLTDRAGEIVTTAYDGKGKPLSSTSPTGGVTSITYEPSTRLPATVTDSDTGTTSFDFDNLSRLEKMTRPDGTEVQFTYNALDRVVTTTDEDGVITRFIYDANSNIVQIINAEATPDEQSTSFIYDALDRLATITDPQGQTTTMTYDYHGEPVSITYSDGSSSNLHYDKRRSLIRSTDEEGHATELARTASDLINSVTTPLGRSTIITRDPRGFPTQIKDPTGDLTKYRYDAFGIITSETDPLDRATTRTLDGEGRKLTQNDPRHGTSTYARDGFGRISKLTDPQGGEWDSIYSPMGRLLSFEDPEDRAQTRTYDSRGRLATLTNPDGVAETLIFNPDSTVQSRTFSDGLTHTMTYDALNRLKSAARTLDAKTETLSLVCDNRDDVVSTTLNGHTTTATYDSRRRLETLVFPGLGTITYTYDKRGLVTRLTDSLTNATIDFTYNADGEVTSSSRSNGRTTTYAYDGEGLLKTLSHDTGATIEWTHNKADEPVSMAETGFPAEALPNFANATENLTFSASSEITTASHSGDSRGRRTSDPTRANYTWDADNRLRSVTRSGQTISYCYDVLGNITSRQANGVTTEYVYSHAFFNPPIIGEHQNGTLMRIYVPLPDGRLAYFIDNPATAPVVHFYHFGKTGNTRFVTDASGAVTDAYAYDPFGQLLNRTGTSDQIYTYVGAFGVRNDEAASLSHMRHRYYDPASRRFLSRDPIFQQLYATRSGETNPYHYARNLPTSAIDPDGLQTQLVGDNPQIAGLPEGAADFPIGIGGVLIGTSPGTENGFTNAGSSTPTTPDPQNLSENGFRIGVGGQIFGARDTASSTQRSSQITRIHTEIPTPKRTFDGVGKNNDSTLKDRPSHEFVVGDKTYTIGVSIYDEISDTDWFGSSTGAITGALAAIVAALIWRRRRRLA